MAALMEDEGLLPVTPADEAALEALDNALGFLTHLERPIILQALARHRLAHSEPRPVAGFTWPEPKFVPIPNGQQLNPERIKAAFELLNDELVIGEQFQLIEMLLDGTEYTIATHSPAPTEAGIPGDIAAHVRKIGRVEWGQTPAHDAEGHGRHVADSVRMTAAHFGQTDDQHMHGLWLVGTETVLCHTGTSPNAPQTTRALVGAWNWLVDQVEASTQGGAEA